MSNWKNTTTHYGLLTILLHWVSAITVFALFGVGLYMMSLSYLRPTLPIFTLVAQKYRADSVSGYAVPAGLESC